MRCSSVAAAGALIAATVSACGRDTAEEVIGSTSAELAAWANGNISQVLRVNPGEITVRNICELTVPLSSAKPLTFIASDPVNGPVTSLAWKGNQVTNGMLSVNGCPSYPCDVIARFHELGANGSAVGCNVIADDGTSSLIGTSTGNALTVSLPPSAPIIFNQDVKIGASGTPIAGSCVLRDGALLPSASVNNFQVSVNGTTLVNFPSPMPIGDVSWPTPIPSVPFGKLYVGSEIGATRIKHVTGRAEQLTEGAALRCGGMYFDGPNQVYDVNVNGIPVGMGVSLVRGTTGWTCGAASFGTGDGCDSGCGIADPDCSCLTNTDCGSGTYCGAAGACVPEKANGQSCTAAWECQSHACPNQICCSFGSGFNRVNLSAGLNPSFVAIGEFNKDGFLDLVVAEYGPNTVSRRLNDGLGNFLAATSYSVGLQPNSIAIGDFNGDTNADLAVANSGSTTVSALLGTPGGSFSPQVQFPSGAAPSSVATGDFNNDGVLDLAVANSTDNNLSVLLGTGLGTFLAPVTYGTGINPVSVVTANFNGDSYLDIAVANAGDLNGTPSPAGTVSVLLGAGGGAFSLPTTIDAGGIFPFSVTAGDFNGDAVPDLALAIYGDPLLGDATASVLLGTGAGTFLPPQTYSLLTTLPGAQAIAVFDYNADGKRDLVVAGASSKISILLGTGTGTFSVLQPMSFVGLNNNGSVAVGDLNGDTGEDVVVSNFGTDTGSGAGNSVSVLYNRCVP